MVLSDGALRRIQPIRPFKDRTTLNGCTFGLSAAGYDVRIAEDVFLWPGRFLLASTVEYFDMPDDVVGIVHDKSTWARQGLSVFNTVIEPGFNGGLTLELVFHGNKELVIPAGAGIAQVIFTSLAHDAYYEGKYNGQSTDPTPSIFD